MPPTDTVVNQQYNVLHCQTKKSKRKAKENE
jgi:hypothetical protein